MDRWQDKHTAKKDRRRRKKEEENWAKRSGPVVSKIDPSIVKKASST